MRQFIFLATNLIIFNQKYKKSSFSKSQTEADNENMNAEDIMDHGLLLKEIYKHFLRYDANFHYFKYKLIIKNDIIFSAHSKKIFQNV